MSEQAMREETETFADGRRTVRYYDAENRLHCIETYSADDLLVAATDYLYGPDGVNHERVVRDGAGTVLRRMHFDAEGNELNPTNPETVRWASMDGTEEGVAPKGQEDTRAKPVSSQDHD